MGKKKAGEKHEEWHRKHRKMTSEEHDGLIRRMGITEEEHEVWHELHGTRMGPEEKGMRRPVDPFAVGGAFLEYCVRKKWLVREGHGHGAKYYPTQKGMVALRRFGLDLEK